MAETLIASPKPSLGEQFDDVEQQRFAAEFAMWIFLGTEVLFFGGLFVAYTVYRYEYPEVFEAGSRHLSMISGAVMTGLLLLGSLFVALSDQWIYAGLRWRIVTCLSLTLLMGIAFLSLEFSEYADLISQGLYPQKNFPNEVFLDLPHGGRSAAIFFSLFFFMTGLHAIHMIIGNCLVLYLTLSVAYRRRLADLRNTATVIGLYWHFVDIIWIFLFPLYYLIEK